jgi:hypothetical protein
MMLAAVIALAGATIVAHKLTTSITAVAKLRSLRIFPFIYFSLLSFTLGIIVTP